MAVNSCVSGRFSFLTLRDAHQYRTDTRHRDKNGDYEAESMALK